MYNVTMAVRGNIPVVLTVPHDGGLISFNKEEIPIRRPERQNDAGTRYVAYQICNDMERRFDKRPFVLFQKVERQRLTREIILQFYKRVLQEVRFCLDKWVRCYLLDLHAFKNQPSIGDYDIVLGTDHRRTVCDRFDLFFGKNLEQWFFWDKDGRRRNLDVYIPGAEPKEGERFAATKDFTLVKWIKGREPRVSALQIEIFKDWLMIDHNTEMFIKTLSSNISLNTI